jgi:hypothetical protein
MQGLHMLKQVVHIDLLKGYAVESLVSKTNNVTPAM